MNLRSGKSRQYLLILIDLCCLLAVYLFYTLLYLKTSEISYMKLVCNFTVFAVCIFASKIAFGIYSNIWRYASFFVYLKMVSSNFIGAVIAVGITFSTGINIEIWQNISIVSIATLAEITLRFLYQYNYQEKNLKKQKDYTYIVIVGAGNVGTMLARELLYNKNSKYRPYCFIDTDKRKIGSKILELEVLDGNNEKILEIVKKLPVKDIILAFSDKNRDRIEKLYTMYSQTGLNIKVYDYPFTEETNNTHNKRILREIKIEDLLFRAPILMKKDEIISYYSGKTILITGGGGSIGSELCRQIASKNPKQLVIVDIYENNAYEIQQELIMKYGNTLNLSVEIASVRDKKRLDEIFKKYRPEIVFHAAAHKHVPLMENNPQEAVKNNCMGTQNAADIAEKYGSEKFILISTDKAVNPTNIMGASKRICEMIVQSRSDSKTSFAAVRFGNVLGSNGSVVPLFKKQIEKGGPITITDKRIIRYFMTISEACQLLLHTGLQAKHGELFVLDMGKPIKILDLAENMIRLSGFTPYKDIDIKEIGLRPGEKLYEELLVKTESTEITSHDMIFVEKAVPPTRKDVNEKLEFLLNAVEKSLLKNDTEIIKEALHKTVPSYHNSEELNAETI